MVATNRNDDDALRRLQRQLAWSRGIAILALLGVIALAIAWYATTRSHHGGILRTQGIIVTDAQGHDTILIGAPAIAASGQTKKYGDTNSIAFIGPSNTFRLFLGQAPEPVVEGKATRRIGNGDVYGVTLYDTQGNERGGMGFIGGADRAVVALDRPGMDAVGMMVDDKTGYAGLMLNYAKGADSSFEVGTRNGVLSVVARDPRGTERAVLKVEGPQAPAWRFSAAAPAGSTGKP